ncbi:hypothetical protein SCRM01_246 [Synechococcus phage S-CRM01]|uniref:hypothetical protein n=1 Tax=Synechococcus phage S-CRM01 TaxID=1026955 RepID=UPI000209E447|nr:hypothetical protein SCRM01_246 [Synechococcus phage S-CRM01]AEC53192.1 hypothetical protein SCRM01_246 [Synechococcus phage S-CRM01]
MAIEVTIKESTRNYPYVVVHGVRMGPAIAVGMTVALAYVEKTVDEAIAFVAKIHPEVEVTSVVNYVEA